MKTPILTSSRSSPTMNRTIDSTLDPIQQRTRTAMLKASKLANFALDLEKEQQWVEALDAYSEVCTFFKKIMEGADSKDLHDLIYLYQQYSKRLNFLKNKVVSSGKSLTQQNTLLLPPSPPGSPQLTKTNPLNSAQESNPTSPRFIRNRSESYTTPSKPSPLSNIRRPSLAPTCPLPPIPTTPAVSQFPVTLSKKPSETSLRSFVHDSKTYQSNFRGTEDKKTATNLSSDLDSQSRRPFEVSFTSPLKGRQESRRPLDLNSIPEITESGTLKSRSRGLFKKGDVSPQSKPRLTHNPSMPNLSGTRPLKIDVNSLSTCDKKLYRTLDTPLFSNHRRDSYAVPPEYDFTRPGGFSSPKDNSFLFEAVLPRSTSRITSKNDHNHTDFLTQYSPEASNSSLIDSSPDSSPRLSFNSISNSTLDDISFTGLPGPSSMIRSHTSPHGPPLSIYTQLPVRSAAELLSPNNLNSPLPSSDFYSAFTPKYNLSIFQVLWNEEVLSKPIWRSPPKSAALRPLWQIGCLQQTLTTGGFVGSKRIFISPSIWKQSGLKLPGLDVKIHVLTYLQEYLTRLGEHWLEDVLGIRQGLEDLEALTSNMHQTLASKLEVIPPLRRSQNSATTALFSLANKISKSVERFQASVSRDKLEDNTSYLELLVKFFDSCKFIENWYLHFTNRNSLHTIHTAIVQRLQRFLEFLNSVIIVFVLNDLNICLAKYFKRIRELALE